MFDKLIEVALEFLDDLMPFAIIMHYNRGVRLRYGKKASDTLEPGLYFKWPFIDTILTVQVKATTIGLFEQSITTKDDKSIVVKAIVKYEVDNAAKLLLEVNDAIDAIADMTQGIIRKEIVITNWADCNSKDLESRIKNKAKTEAKKWGISISEVTLTDLGLMRSIRLFKSEKETTQ